MDKRKKLNEQIVRFQNLDEKGLSIDRKLDELIQLLEHSELDSETVTKLQNKFNTAVESSRMAPGNFREFEKLDDRNLTRIELANDLENLLTKYELDSEVSKRVLIAEKTRQVTLLVISLLLVVLGFAMIIMPAPPYFEMFTIFYFTPDDGVTLMDLISLLIVFTGVYLLTTSIIKLKRQK